MDAEENSEIYSNDDFLLLLAKKRKLLDLREDLLARRQCQVNEGTTSSDNPDSPISTVTQSSITPPPFSPLTPLISKTINNRGEKDIYVSNPDTPESNKPTSPLAIARTINENEMQLQCESNPDTPLSHLLQDIGAPKSIPLLSKNIEKEPLSSLMPSPIPPMSPETQNLFNVLTQNDSIFESNASDVIENSEISEEDGNCDDSVADPDFDINLENESETDCELYDDDDEHRTKKEKNNEDEEKARNEIRHKNVNETPELLPKINTRYEDNDDETVANPEVLAILTPEKETRNDKGLRKGRREERKNEENSDIPSNDEHGTLKMTPKKNSEYEEKDSPVINIECLEILTTTPEKEMNIEEHKEVEISISPPVKRIREEGNNSLIPTVQIRKIGTISPVNLVETMNNTIGNNDLVPTMEIRTMLPEDVDETTSDNIEKNNLVPSTSELNTGRPKKGRKRKHAQTNSERKYNKYNNLQYTTVCKQKKIEPKVFVAFKCKCLKKCYNLISEQTRKEEFKKFVTLGSYKAQLMYIASCVTEEKKKRSYTMTSIPANKKKPKQFHRTYTLKGVKVCRDMFLNTLQITTQKVTMTLTKLRNNNLDDGRGSLNGGYNKLDEDHVNFIIEVISKLPKYESHYRRDKSNEALYLEPGMTLSKIYDIYQKMFSEKFGNEKKCASFGYVKKIFLTKFNLRCKSLKKDTCNKCDLFAVQIQNAKSSTEKEQIETDKSTHLEKAETLRNQMKRDFKNAQENENIECLSFDLEKTLPLPRIPTNVVFYKRQLWFYNSGIHSASDDVGHCYVWVEGEAGRGAQEVGSCLIKYIENKLRPTAEHLILWSDCCGGQNRNIKIVLMLKAILNTHLTLKKISFRYLESGHTFLPNDTDFSKIETALKKQQRVYTAEEYIYIIRNAKKRNPFKVYKMEKTDFYGTEIIEKKIINRKKFTDKTKVNWLQAKEIMIEKEKPYYIFMRSSFEENFMTLNIQKNSKGERFEINKSDFTLLWPNGKPIAPAKLADLQSLFKYIPSDCLQFYKQLKASEDVVDDVDGFGGVTDFVPDVED